MQNWTFDSWCVICRMLHSFGHSLTIAYSRKCYFPASVTQNYNYEQHKHTIFLLLTRNYRFLVSKSHIYIPFVPALYPTLHAFMWPRLRLFRFRNTHSVDYQSDQKYRFICIPTDSQKTTLKLPIFFIHRHNYLKRSIDQSQSLPDRSVDRWARSRLSVFGVVWLYSKQNKTKKRVRAMDKKNATADNRWGKH